jgi:pimeloyl-ACP methyl ester carboxylesterase
MRVQNPVVVVPGITATELYDDYPMTTEELWTMVIKRNYERITLHPDDLRYEAIEPAHVFAGRAFSIYDDLIKALRHELSARADRPTPVFVFPYDWRMDIRRTGVLLGQFVEEVVNRTKLLKHYAKMPILKVDLVGHSMGGLVILEYLQQLRNTDRVNRVVTIGTPFLGSPEAIVKVATGMSLLSGDEPTEREREAARATPSVYQLFPSYARAVTTSEGLNVDLFDPQNMQTSVVDSLTEFVRLHSVGVPKNERRIRALSILGNLVEAGRTHRMNVMAFKIGRVGVAPTDWLAIVGMGRKTRVQLSLVRTSGGMRFVIDDKQFVDELAVAGAVSRSSGDGTVPLEGAIPPFLDERSIVCVMPKDMGLFELRDRLLAAIGGFHGLLPAVNLVQRLVVRHLKPDYRGQVWGRRLPGATSWEPPIRGLEERE